MKLLLLFFWWDLFPPEPVRELRKLRKAERFFGQLYEAQRNGIIGEAMHRASPELRAYVISRKLPTR